MTRYVIWFKDGTQQYIVGNCSNRDNKDNSFTIFDEDKKPIYRAELSAIKAVQFLNVD